MWGNLPEKIDLIKLMWFQWMASLQQHWQRLLFQAWENFSLVFREDCRSEDQGIPALISSGAGRRWWAVRWDWSPSTRASHGGAEASCTSKKALPLAHYILSLLNKLCIQCLDFPPGFSFSAQDFLAGNHWMIPLVTASACKVGWEPVGCSAEKGRLRHSSSLMRGMRRERARVGWNQKEQCKHPAAARVL